MASEGCSSSNRREVELLQGEWEGDGSVIEKKRWWGDFRHGVSYHLLCDAMTEFYHLSSDEVADVMEFECDVPGFCWDLWRHGEFDGRCVVLEDGAGTILREPQVFSELSPIEELLGSE